MSTKSSNDSWLSDLSPNNENIKKNYNAYKLPLIAAQGDKACLEDYIYHLREALNLSDSLSAAMIQQLMVMELDQEEKKANVDPIISSLRGMPETGVNSMNGSLLVVYNSLAWTRREVVQFQVDR